MTAVVLGLKTLLDCIAAWGWWFNGDNAQAWMFIGFAIADMACLAVAMR